MNDNRLTTYEILKLGAIPDNMIYWHKPQDRAIWAQQKEDCMPWEIEVDFE